MRPDRKTSLRIEYLNKEKPLITGEAHKIRFRLTDVETKRPNSVLKDVGVLVFLSPGMWQERHVARSAGDGLYEITVNVPEEGVYFVFVESPSQRIQYRELPYLMLHATTPAGERNESLVFCLVLFLILLPRFGRNSLPRLRLAAGAINCRNSGFAAGCEAGLRPAGRVLLRHWAMPLVRALPKPFGQSPHQGRSPRFSIQQAGRSPASHPAAKPFLNLASSFDLANRSRTAATQNCAVTETSRAVLVSDARDSESEEGGSVSEMWNEARAGEGGDSREDGCTARLHVDS